MLLDAQWRVMMTSRWLPPPVPRLSHLPSRPIQLQVFPLPLPLLLGVPMNGRELLGRYWW